MARRSGWNAACAWRFIRSRKACRQAWKRCLPHPCLLAGAPFPVRLRSVVGALRWDRLALEDPHAEFPLALFWVQAGVLDGQVTRNALPLAAGS